MKAKKKYAEMFTGKSPKDYKNLDDRHKKVLEIFSKYRFERLLDVGCGDGNFTMLLARACKAKEVYGIEISEKGVELARKNGVKCYQLDIDEEDFPFEDNYFDAVFAGEVIEHLYDPDHFLDEVYRVLKPGGVFVLTTPNLASLYNRVALLFGFLPYTLSCSLRHSIGYLYKSPSLADVSDHIRAYTLHALMTLLELHGFYILSVRGSSGRAPDDKSLLKRLLDILSIITPSLSFTIVIEALKT